MPRPIAPLLILLFLVLGCDDTFVDPFENEARYYTVYGYLDVLETRHELRVVPVTRTPERIDAPTHPQADLDAEVTTTDLTTGQVRRWTHDLEPLGDGTYGHIFRADFIPQPGRTYRLEVKRSDGKTTTAETTVPLLNRSNLFVRDTLVYAPDSSVVMQTIEMPGIVSPWAVEGIYLMTNQQLNDGSLNGRFFVEHGRIGEPTDDGWTISIDLKTDLMAVKQELDDYRAQGVYDDSPAILEAFGIQIRVLDGNWTPPEGAFDPEVLAQPGALSNVVNGYGFFGSIGLGRQEWNVPVQEAFDLGYPW